MAPRIEKLIDDLAARQHGLVTRDQLIALGVEPDAVKYRVRTRRLWPGHRGVYRVGPPVAPLVREMAAVLACGPHAVLSHESAAALWRLLRQAGAPTLVHVTVRTGALRRRPGVRVHRGRPIQDGDTTTLSGIPITTPPRTVLDLAGVLADRRLERVVAWAEREGLVTYEKLRARIGRDPVGRGYGRLLRLLDLREGPQFGRSEGEDRFSELAERYGLPAPDRNALVCGFEVDFLWRAEGLVVEIDGYEFHSSRESFEADHRKGSALVAAGYTVMRITWRQLVDDPDGTMDSVRRALDRARR